MMSRMSGSLAESFEHAAAAESATEFFSSVASVDAVLLVGSWARGRARTASDLDLAILIAAAADEAERSRLEAEWERSPARERAEQPLSQIVRYSGIDIDVIDGEFAPKTRSWTSGPDDFELRIGNYVACSVPLFERGDRYRALRDRWLPFYDDRLRAERLESVRTYCLNNLDHVGWSLERGDRFHAFHRLYNAFHEFLQALFISRRTYPVSYDKWVADQLELAGLRDVAAQAAGIVGVAQLDSAAIGASAAELRRLFADHVE
jgi:predicted nucleotidyltransferase